MGHETTLLHCADLLVQLQELREQSGELRAESRSLLAESRRQQDRSPWPHLAVPLEPVDCVAPLPDQPAQHQAGDQPGVNQNRPIESAAHTDALEKQGDQYILTEQEIVVLIVRVLDYLPLEQQIQVAKALCSHTMTAVRARLDPRLVRSA